MNKKVNVGFLIFVLIGLVVLGSVLYSVAVNFGFIKSKFTVSIEVSEGEEVNASEFQMIAVNTSGKYKEISVDYDAENQNFVIKLPKGTYDLYFLYEGVMYCYERGYSNGTSTYGGNYDFSSFNWRLMEVTFFDENGEEMTVSDVAITTSDGEEVYLCSGKDGAYYVFSRYSDETSWTICAEGYEEVTVDFDAGEYRAGDLEVMLTAA